MMGNEEEITAARPRIDCLSPGVHEIFEPIRLAGSEPVLAGRREDGRVVTRLRRGVLPDGSLYRGHLIEIDGAVAPVVKDLIIEGGRISTVSGAVFDARHPLNPDRTAPDFMCASVLPEPECYAPHTFASSFSSDIAVRNCQGGHISDVMCDGPVRIGIAVGHGVSGLQISGCQISGAGDYGVWIGFGGPLEDPSLPINDAYRAQLPRDIRLDGVMIERCGAAGLFSEAIRVEIVGCSFLENCTDAPYDDEGGQVTADYKSDGLSIRDSVILAAPAFVRRRRDGNETLLGAFGIEACGANLLVENTIIEGNSREGVQIVGARDTVFRSGVRVVNNALAQTIWPHHAEHHMRTDISITTTQGMAVLGAIAARITLEDLRCENGVAVWSDGVVPRMRLDDLTVRRCALGGSHHQGVYVGLDSHGDSVAGDRWDIEQ